jgi:internalin A
VLSKLSGLVLSETNVTDSGLAHLKELKNLSFLDVTGTRVTDAGIKELKQALPRLTIDR